MENFGFKVGTSRYYRSGRNRFFAPVSGVTVGTMIACGLNTQVKVYLLGWDGAALSELDAYNLPGNCYGIAFNPTHDLIATTHGGGDYMSLLQWNGVDLTLKDTFHIRDTAYMGTAWSPVTNHIFCGQDVPEARILLWDGSNLSSVHEYDSAFQPRQPSFNPLGTFIAIIGDISPRFEMLSWNGSVLASADTYTLPGEGEYCQFNPTGDFVACAHEGGDRFSVLAWDGADITLADTYTFAARTRYCTWHPTGSFIAVTGDGGNGLTVLGWDGANLSLAYNYPDLANGFCSQFDPSGTLIAYSRTSSPQVWMMGWDGATLTKLTDRTLNAYPYRMDFV